MFKFWDAINKAWQSISTDKPLPVDVAQADAMIPTDIQSHLQNTIQTHNAVNVALNSFSDGSWIDTDGFDKVVATIANDAATSNSVDLFWSPDGTNIQSVDSGIIPSGTLQRRSVVTDTKMRYIRVRLNNLDTSAAHTMNGFLYLKA